MTIIPLPDVVGASSAIAISTFTTQPVRARRIFLTAVTTSTARLGDSTVSATKGVALPAAQTVIVSASDGDIGDGIDLTRTFLFVPTGTTVTLSIGI